MRSPYLVPASANAQECKEGHEQANKNRHTHGYGHGCGNGTEQIDYPINDGGGK